MTPLFKDTIREIKKTKSRFFSIFAIVLIGVAFFSGVSASSKDMQFSADKYFDDYNLMDIRVVSNFGLTKDDVNSIKGIDGIKNVYAGYTKDYLFNHAETQQVVRVSTFNLKQLKDVNYINQFKVVEGRMPTKSNECLAEKGKMLDGGIKVGDVISLSSGDGSDINETLNKNQFEVVGLINTPYYLSYEKGSSDIGAGTVNTYIYIDDSNFNMDVYTDVFLTIDGAEKYNSYDDEYFDYIKDVTVALESLGNKQAVIRYNDIKNEAVQKLNEAKVEYENGVIKFDEEIAKANKKIEDGENEILLGKSQIASAKMVLASQLEAGRSQIAMMQSQISSLETQYETYKKQYESQNEQAIKQKEALLKKNEEINTKQLELKSKYDEVNQQIDGCNQKIKELNSEIDTLNAQLNEVNDEMSKLDINDPEYAIKFSELQSKQNDLNNQIVEKNIELQKINAELLSAHTNPSYVEYNSNQLLIESNNTSISLIDSGLNEANKAINAVGQQIDSVKKQISDAENKLNETEQKTNYEISLNESKIKKAEQDLIAGKIELENEKLKGEEKLLNAKEEIIKAEQDIEKIEDCKWYVLDRNSHYSYVDYKGATNRMASIAKIFPVFFFIVAGLVCLTTMTRLVDEQRGQIGTMKALGYKTSQIAFKYVFYAGSASILGSVFGLIIGMILFPWIIYTAWNLMYILPNISYTLQWPLIISTIIISVLVTTITTFWACYAELVETPSLLMRPKAPKIGKKILLERISFLWNRFSFTSKVTVRNLFRYKKRMAMTIVGISGCTALLVAGFGIKDSISDIVDIQFNKVFNYDGIITLKSDLLESDKLSEANKFANLEGVDDTLLVSMTVADLMKDSTEEVNLIVADEVDRLNEFVDMHHRTTGEAYTLSSDGVVITEKVCNDLNIKKNDKVLITNSNGVSREFKVIGIMENYVNHAIYMSSSAYKEAFSVRPEYNSVYVRTEEGISENDLGMILKNQQSIETVSFYSGFVNNFSGMIESLNYIVIVLVISAGALAFVVLYNLTNVNISERIREIATLKVLGFRNNEVNKYVYKENILLTIMGAIVGLLLGKALHYTIMVVVELDNIMFGRNINFISYVISFIITIIFAIIVNFVMKKRLKNIPMVESLKSVE